ncbi:MAG: DUF4190 domain-containing protein [Pyrinomonadaceae bacterium]|nr:DUF4190 domain-containing protein [Pyrinomonadaceae bacterium]
MKFCPVCNQTYTDDNLNFCLTDGGTLNDYKDNFNHQDNFNSDVPPTVLLNQTRTTQPNWQNYEPAPPWQNQPLQSNQASPLQPNQPFYPAQYQAQNQTLPTVSLVLGIFGILFTCCYGGIPLGAAAVVTGYVGLKNANENSQQFGGRGLAIAGMITGAVGLLISVGIFLIAIIAQLG